MPHMPPPHRPVRYHVFNRTRTLPSFSEVPLRLIPLTCPACGATLSIDAERTMATCPHCGRAYLMDDETEHVSHENGYAFGYDFERGRMQAREGDGSDPTPGTTPQTLRQAWDAATGTQATTPDPVRVPPTRGRLTPAGGCLATLSIFVLVVLLLSALPRNHTETAGQAGSLATSATEPASGASTAQSDGERSSDSPKPGTDVTATDAGTSGAATSSGAKSSGPDRDEVRSRYDQASVRLAQDLEAHGTNDAFAAYDGAVEDLWALAQRDGVSESELSETEASIESTRQSFLDTAAGIEHEAERAREEAERAERAERAEVERIANIEASYVDPEVLQTVYGTLDHRSKAIDLWSSDLMTYPLCTGSEEYFDAFDDWMTLHEHYEYTKKYATGPFAVGPGDLFYVSDQEMADATTELCQLRRNMVVTYEIDHPES